MGPNEMSELPPLPKGFVLDGEQSAAMPPLPAGFKLDAAPGKVTLGDIGNQALTDIKNFGGRLLSGVESGATYARDVSTGDAQLPGVHYMKPGQTSISDEDMARGQASAMSRLMDMTGLGLPINPAIRSGDAIIPGMGALKKVIPAPLPTSAESKASARAVWNDPAIKNTEVPDVGRLASSATNDLLNDGYRPTPGSAPGTFGELKNLTPPEPKPAPYWDRVQAEMNGQPVPTATEAIKSVSVDDLRAARRALNMVAKQTDLKGQPIPDAVAARTVINKIDEHLDTIDPRLRTANADYAAGKATDLVNFRQMKADRRAAKTGSGSNMENTMRQEVDKIPDRGLTASERALREQIVMGDNTRNALRKVGKLGFSDGLSLLMHSGAALGTGGATIPIGIGGTVARKVGEKLTRDQIRQLSEMIRARSPLALSRPPQTVPYGQFPPYSPQMLGLPFQWPPQMLGAVPARADNNQR